MTEITLTLNPATASARDCERKTEGKLAGYKIIGHGEEHPDLGKVLVQSLLGIAAGRIDMTQITDYEKRLYARFLASHEAKPIKTLVVMDIDGVLVSPVHNLLGHLIYGKAKDRALDVGHWLSFRKIVEASSQTIVWSNRLKIQEIRSHYPMLGHLLDLFKDSENLFPFISPETAEKLKRIGKGKLTIAAGKSNTVGNGNSLEGILKEKDFDLAIIIGSSAIDRQLVKQFSHDCPDLAGKTVFFDTGHLIL